MLQQDKTVQNHDKSSIWLQTIIWNILPIYH